MPKTFFVTGTDTGVGKTTISCALLARAREQGLGTLGLKPVAAGCERTPEGLRNEDALALLAVMSEPLGYDEVNPVALPEPLSPHLAAALAGKRLTSQQIAGFIRGSLTRRADFALVEGAGGWRVPISDREFFSDIARLLRLPVVLVVGLRLGCINHAMLTAEAVIRDGLRIAGWVGNTVDPEMQALDGNIETLRRLLPFPCLGIVPWSPQAGPAERGAALDLAPLLES